MSGIAERALKLGAMDLFTGDGLALDPAALARALDFSGEDAGFMAGADWALATESGMPEARDFASAATPPIIGLSLALDELTRRLLSENESRCFTKALGVRSALGLARWCCEAFERRTGPFASARVGRMTAALELAASEGFPRVVLPSWAERRFLERAAAGMESGKARLIDVGWREGLAHWAEPEDIENFTVEALPEAVLGWDPQIPKAPAVALCEISGLLDEMLQELLGVWHFSQWDESPVREEDVRNYGSSALMWFIETDLFEKASAAEMEAFQLAAEAGGAADSGESGKRRRI